eukprot:CAMPEP_0181023114 /NCGR_PEP_ID=MMETSP1070-20121207/1876_1 /TAXON_ID=265543 /ORGANISM="Minutocellus polymorphus, Strain NH13" /LENGTH=85 /DNA_ID=CAMNT_0023100103 /DNA_START=64 /DNA_END=321 /DNA_ORIENTATION=+
MASVSTAANIGTAVGAVQSPDISDKISAVGTGGGGSNSDASNLQGKKDGVRSVLIKTKDGEEWPIDVEGEIMMRTEDGGEYPVLP